MPNQTSCDHTLYGRDHNVLSLGTEGVLIIVRWVWDGVSTWPDCDGALDNVGTGADRWAIHANNIDTVPWQVHTLNKQGNPKVFTLNPGQEVFITAQQAASSGYSVISDFNNITMTRGLQGEADLQGDARVTPHYSGEPKKGGGTW